MAYLQKNLLTSYSEHILFRSTPPASGIYTAPMNMCFSISSLYMSVYTSDANTLSRPVVKHKVQINTGRSNRATVLLEVRVGVQPKSQQNQRYVKYEEI